MAGIEIDDRDAQDDRERQDSRILLDTLSARRAEIGGEAVIPEDKQLTERILEAAKKRSTELSGARTGSVRTVTSQGKPISWWLWIAWPLAIAAVAATFWILHHSTP